MNSFVEAILHRNDGWYLALLGGGAMMLLAAGLYFQGSKSKYPLPPGPKGSLIIGNLRQVPAERSDVQFAQWAKEFSKFDRDLASIVKHMSSNGDTESDIIYVNLLGQPVIVLNSVKSAIDLLDKKGAIYSDRPPFVVLEALGFKPNLALIGDGAQFRKLRKAYGNFLSARSSLAYRDAQLKYADKMAEEIKESPENWHSYLSRFATRVIFSVAFAIDVEDEDDPYFKLADKMGWIISNMGNNGITILDIAPWVQHLPYWIAKFIPSVKYVQDHAPTIKEFHQRPFDEVVQNFKAGTLQPSFIGRLINARETRAADEEEAIKNFTDSELRGTGGSLYSAGQDTTFSTETTFVMAMVLAPEVQTRAQKEIDAVTKGARMPTFDDWAALPIVERIVYETLRFHPAVPNGVPHRTLKEDIYCNMYIPKGNSMVIANAWAMLHDSEIYKDPFTFNPDRYLPLSEGGADEPIPTGQFGFGRRVCPGQYLGFASIWIVVATILAKFDISPVKDEEEKDILPRLEFSTGITSHPMPFSCTFTPRKSL
ncbi:cytochrome p450 monooxygenase [Stipitochalara longipes BDJ]|nr:cytochrome p450 monooxygenase [Stipitochalara longipes BDJ]